MAKRQPPMSGDDQAEFVFVEATAPKPAQARPNRRQRRAESPAPVPAKPAPATRVAIRPADVRQPTRFETLLHAELGNVYNLCLRLTQDAARAEDLSQEVFVRASNTEEEASPLWLLRAAVAVFQRDRRYNRPRRPVAREPAPAAPVYELPEAWDGVGEEHRTLLSALGTLEADDRVMLVLKDVEGRPYTGVAEISWSSEASVRARVGAARERLHAAVRRVTEQKKP